jgi:hypothetical protein
MSAQDFIKAEAGRTYNNDIHLYASQREGFTAGATLMLQHMGGFAKWSRVMGWEQIDLDRWVDRGTYKTTTELIEMYFDQLNTEKK